MSEPLPEIALTEDEIDQILRGCQGRAVLVGGQALAFWAQHYAVTPLGVLSSNVTSDVDFLGSAQAARQVAETLKPLGWRFWRPAMDDATPQTAKLSKRIEGKGIKQIDFLGSIIGLETKRIKQRAVGLHLADGTELRVLHPLDVLESRLKNMVALPSKRDSQGIAQAHLAIDIARAYLEQLGRERRTRALLNAIERVGHIALDKSLAPILHEFNLDPLAAVPVDRVQSAEFHKRRWPQLLALVAEQRKDHPRRKRQRRRSANVDKKP